MVSTISIHLAYESLWRSSGGTWVRGVAFVGQQPLQGAALARKFESVSTDVEFCDVLNKLNGFFAVIHRHADRVFVGVDRVRSVPLFYGTKAGRAVVSDDAEAVRDQLGLQDRNAPAEKEFLLTGYVTGPETLYSGLYQMQSGEAMELTAMGANVTRHMTRYFRYLHTTPSAMSLEDLLESNGQMLERVFRRLVALADGRTVVVPLSGGYDSRLIVLMLKRLGYDRVVAYTYGRHGNREAEISREVAKNLGVRWEFVPYSNRKWYQWYRTGQRRQYYRMAHGYSSLPHLQDWPAVWMLHQERRIPDDSLFVPGHSADLLAGSRSKNARRVYHCGTFDAAEVTEEILQYHYRKKSWADRSGVSETALRERVGLSLGDVSTFISCASAFESWDVQERQAKFIINAVRVYDMWGYDWWLPFWDAEFMSFWSRVDMHHRLDCGLYRTCVEQLYMEVGRIGDRRARESDKVGLVTTIRDVLRKAPFYRVLREGYRRHIEYRLHPLAFWGILSSEQRRKYCSGRETINEVMSRLCLEE